MLRFDGRNLSVLVIEDNENFRRLVRAVLQSLGITAVAEAQDGVAALAYLRSQNTDLIICDWNMEPMNGVAFAQMLRRGADSPNRCLPIIMVTGYSEDALVAQARDAGVDEFLTKPIAAQTLIGTIVSVLEERRRFVSSTDYFGPDRRRRKQSWSGEERRKSAPVYVKPDPVGKD